MKLFLRIIFIIILCSITCGVFAQVNFIKVKLTTLKKPFSISSSQYLSFENVINFKLKKKKIIFNILGKKNIVINKQFQVNGKIIINSKRLIKFNRKYYKGKFILIPTSNGIEVINLVNIEDYVHGVVFAEMPYSWDIEALKSQAVVSRTYALFKKQRKLNQNWHVESTTQDQVYYGYQRNKKIAIAVKATESIIVTQNQQIVPTYFHANAGGTTEIAQNVWTKKLNHIKAVLVPFGKSDPNYYWKYRIHKNHFLKKIKKNGFNLSNITQINVLSRTASGRAKDVQISQVDQIALLNANKLRKILGENRLKSTKFSVTMGKKYIYFQGQGFGHGIGLCQWCAKEMAEQGYKFDQIIKGFYKNVNLSFFS